MINKKSWENQWGSRRSQPLRILRIISASSRHRRSLRKTWFLGKGQPRPWHFHSRHGPTWTSLRFDENLRQLIKQMCLRIFASCCYALILSQTWSRNTSAGAVEAKACSPNLKSTPVWDQLLLLSLKCPGVNGDTTESPHVLPSDDCPASLRNSPQHKGAKHPTKMGTIHIQGDQGLCTSLVQGIVSIETCWHVSMLSKLHSTYFSLATVKFIRVVVVLRLLSKKDKSPLFGPKITIAQS